MASDFEGQEVLEAAVAGIPKVAEFIAAMSRWTKGDCIRRVGMPLPANGGRLGLFRGTGPDVGFRHDASSPGAIRTDDGAGNNRSGRRPTPAKMTVLQRKFLPE